MDSLRILVIIAGGYVRLLRPQKGGTSIQGFRVPVLLNDRREPCQKNAHRPLLKKCSSIGVLIRFYGLPPKDAHFNDKKMSILIRINRV